MKSGIISKEEKLNQIKSKVNLNNLKSIVILKKILSYITKNESLNILRYNKKLQKRLNLSINDYKDYSQLYSPIEIELKFDENKCDEKNRFIYILDEEKEYYHIYFDNSKEEIKRNYLDEKEKVNSIKIIIDYQAKSFKKLFINCINISSIFFKKFNRINITDMSYMLYNCSSLRELNVSKFNTNKVNNMCGMFYNCSSLRELNVSNFNTNNVINISGMFFNCSSLNELNVSNFNTEKVII